MVSLVDILIRVAQAGYVTEADECSGLCRATYWHDPELLHLTAAVRHARYKTRLMGASHLGHEARVRSLLAAGAKVEAKDSIGWNALLWASVNGHTAVVTALVAAGANVEAMGT